MNFSIVRAHRDFFRTHRWIECEDVLSPSVLMKINQEVNAVTSNRCKHTFLDSDLDKEFVLGRDLWRNSPLLKKSLHQKGLAEIAAGLTEEKRLRFGVDQYLPAFKLKVGKKGPYFSFVNEIATLKEMTCIQSPVCGAMICLTAPITKKTSFEFPQILNEEPKISIEINQEQAGLEVEQSPIQVFSSLPGNVIFFAPDVPLDFSSLQNLPGASYLLLVYVTDQSVYCNQPKDPQGSYLKQLDYNFGDRLKEHLHPLVYG